MLLFVYTYNGGGCKLRSEQTQKSPNFVVRIHNDLHGWLKDYAKRNNTTMSAVIKDYLYTLRQRDEYQQQTRRRNSETDNFGQWSLGVNGRLSREEIYDNLDIE